MPEDIGGNNWWVSGCVVCLGMNGFGLGRKGLGLGVCGGGLRVAKYSRACLYDIGFLMDFENACNCLAFFGGLLYFAQYNS